ncbi:MAG: sialidase family protein [Chitinophagaceae bacterium]
MNYTTKGKNFLPVLIFSISFLIAGVNSPGQFLAGQKNVSPGVSKIKDIVIYQDSIFYSSFPSIVKLANGRLLLAFRRAPERRQLGEKATNHVDPNSYLVMMQSKDGEAWAKQPDLLYAHAFGGSQDPCLLQLRDNSLLCASYGWGFMTAEALAGLKQTTSQNAKGSIFLGGYLLRSTDGARTWQGPIYPPHIAPEINSDPYGKPVPAYNRGALYEGKDGRIFWVVAANDSRSPGKTSTHLLISTDKGLTWRYSCPVAVDEKVTFNETSVYETPKGDIVAFLRTAQFDDQACIARSTDGGKSFQPWEKMGFQGHPLQALRLPDKRVLLSYGYRHTPFGIRARILNAECTDFATAPEIILRDDGGSSDIGYPWAVLLDTNRVLVTYYYNINNGPRHIAGTILQIK